LHNIHPNENIVLDIPYVYLKLGIESEG